MTSPMQQIEAAVVALRGEIAQVPSAVSAIKVGGKRAYKLAREGQAVELAPATSASTGSTCWPSGTRTGLVDVDVEVDCSSGTYIRALARDVGAALGVGGHLTALRRTRVGRFGLDAGPHSRRPRRAASLELLAGRGLPAIVSAPRPVCRRGGGHPARTRPAARRHRWRLRRDGPRRSCHRAAA